MDFKDYAGWMMTGVQSALITIQTSPTAQKILFYVTLVTAVVNLMYSVQRWYHKAMEDKKITGEEKRSFLKMCIDASKEFLEIFSGNYEINRKNPDIPLITDNVIKVEEPKKELTKEAKIDTIKEEGEIKNEELNTNQNNGQFPNQ